MTSHANAKYATRHLMGTCYLAQEFKQKFNNGVTDKNAYALLTISGMQAIHDALQKQNDEATGTPVALLKIKFSSASEDSSKNLLFFSTP